MYLLQKSELYTWFLAMTLYNKFFLNREYNHLLCIIFYNKKHTKNHNLLLKAEEVNIKENITNLNPLPSKFHLYKY